MPHLTLLSNAGVLLDLGGGVLMIDGLYDARGLPFSDVPDEALSAARPDYLAFTHTHHDHLSREKLWAYLATRPVRGLLLPPRVPLPPGSPPAVVMKGASGAVTLPEFTLRWARTPHLEDAKPEHHSFLVTAGETALLVAGDARPSPALAALVRDIPLTAALLTPLFLQTEEGRRQVLDQLRPKTVFLYHLPRPEDDRWGLGRMAQRQAQRWADTLPVLPLDQLGVPISL